ncbi:Type II/IV secretion system protein TadC, associated with Flp pilus assembly [Vibrio aestuarianus]|uniref:Type II/IV secretion system protein TadC, associated with Flp pilus assembly n=2 Tax=Vibrio aestuarianus TaxID=28171 RepID=A0ABN8TSE0_9VIBR|nr:Type II/IV secretion system protein TadC, associated with Flp pilus assembly [Vibrio aestuarianus]CAH8185849.1 Flp pilus assembly protein TadC [Vibrio aestuarianus subsp. francensis]CAH8185789.1 Type II/IV secretion system protein TadC, associated with Flp pilus assembly [Vibrio aestuarianus]CAH8185895.1 Type II/IV secretion system protein TadC, associated with Flp pilus assembly [Vibrio aestuarianus]CAH8185944.1 Type II/IV secretion system protein TadC, associated with Flp pilus assembly [V
MMDDILNILSSFNLDEQTMILSLILVSVSMLVLTAGFIVIGSKSPLKRKLHSLRESNSSGTLRKSERLGNTLESLVPIVAPKSGRERESIRQKLMHAGFHDSSTLTFFYAVKVMTSAVGVGLAGGVFFFQPDLAHRDLLMIILVALGLFAPNFVLGRMVTKRQRRVRAGVPDALDLLVVCTESGLGFKAALRRVGDEMLISHPDFADELLTVCAKIKAGVEMSDAFQELIQRTGVTEIQGLVSMLAHASRIGGSLSKTLRDYTEDFRDKRNQEVEEIAAKIPTKMIFPLLMFIWPCFFIVAVGPAIIKLLDALS